MRRKAFYGKKETHAFAAFVCSVAIQRSLEFGGCQAPTWLWMVRRRNSAVPELFPRLAKPGAPNPMEGCSHHFYKWCFQVTQGLQSSLDPNPVGGYPKGNSRTRPRSLKKGNDSLLTALPACAATSQCWSSMFQFGTSIDTWWYMKLSWYKYTKMIRCTMA